MPMTLSEKQEFVNDADRYVRGLKKLTGLFLDLRRHVMINDDVDLTLLEAIRSAPLPSLDDSPVGRALKPPPVDDGNFCG